MLTVVILCLLQFTRGFLLDNGNSSIPGKQTYLTAAEYYYDKVQMQQQLALQSQNMVSHGELNLLASQIQSKLNAFEQKLLTQISTGQSPPAIAGLEPNYQELEMKMVEIKNFSDALELKYQDMTKQLSILEQKNKLLEQSLATKEQTILDLDSKLATKHQQITELKQNMTELIAGLENRTLADLQSYVNNQIQPG